MPKQVHYIRDFSGGINSQRNPRDISDNQTPFCQDAMGDRIGMLRTMGNGSGGLRQKDNSSSSKNPTQLASTDLLNSYGYGFKHYELDYDVGGSEQEGGEHYLAIVNSGGRLKIWDYSSDAWDITPTTAGGTVDLGTANDIKANITAFGNGLRLCDSNLDDQRVASGSLLAEPLDNSEPDVDVDEGDHFTAGDIIEVDTEKMLVVSESSDTLTVIRNYLGTAAATHLDNAIVNIVHRTTPKYFKYIKRSQLTTVRDGFYGGKNDLQPPTAGNAESTAYTNGAVNFNITSETDGIGSWKKTDYAFAYTFVYDGNQESVPMICSAQLETANVNADRPFQLDVTIANAGGATDFDARITGSRIYWKYYDSGNSKIEEGEWNLLADCDFTGGVLNENADVGDAETTVDSASTGDLTVGMEVVGASAGVPLGTKVASITDFDTFEMTKAATNTATNDLTFRGSSKSFGVRGKLSDEYTMWTFNATGQYTATIVIQDPSIDTYSTINGYGSNDGKLYIGDSGDGYKAAVYANRRMFVAGVRMTFEDGAQRQKLDRIMYSPVGKPDVFPLSNYIDIVQSDAEPYIKLEAVGDKLFAFKSDNLYIANIAGYASDWYLESTNKGMGVLSGGAVFRTDYGLVWVNPNGLYNYTAGGGISELTEDKILSGYKTDSYSNPSWAKLITAGTIIGYDKKEKEIVIVLDSGSAVVDQSFGGNGADVIVYDLETKSFFFGKNRLEAGGAVASNFDYDWNGDLVYATETGNAVDIKSWQSDDQTSTAFLYQTKDFDFGHPSRYKKIYAVYLTYKHSNSNQAGTFLTYAKDGSDSFVSVDGDSSTALATNSINQATRFEIHKITFTTPLKCQSIALKLNGPTSNATKIEINDIGIEYRLLPSAKVSATD